MTKPGAPAGAPAKNTGGIFQDDGGGPELAKIQMIGFTIIAIGVFLATVFHQIAIGDLKDSLPNIDSSLLVLMGISQGGYLGKKLVTFGTPALYPPSPESGPAGTKVTLTGANLGSSPGSQLMLNGTQCGATWLPTSIQFTVPDDDPATSAPWAGHFPRRWRSSYRSRARRAIPCISASLACACRKPLRRHARPKPLPSLSTCTVRTGPHHGRSGKWF